MAAKMGEKKRRLLLLPRFCFPFVYIRLRNSVSDEPCGDGGRGVQKRFFRRMRGLRKRNGENVNNDWQIADPKGGD